MCKYQTLTGVLVLQNNSLLSNPQVSHFYLINNNNIINMIIIELVYKITSEPTKCNGGKDGKIMLTAQGGTPPYSFQSSGFSSFFLNVMPVYIFSDDLAAPFYNVSVTRSGKLQDSSKVAQSGYYSISFIPKQAEEISFSCVACISSNEVFFKIISDN